MNLKNIFSSIFKPNDNKLTNKSTQTDLEMEMSSVKLCFTFENQKEQKELDEFVDVIIDFQGYEKCQIIENYISFIESINYLSLTFSEKQNINVKLLLPHIKINDIIYLNEDNNFMYIK